MSLGDLNHDDFKSGFIALIGRPNVGKSTFINKFIGEKIAITSPIAQTTRNRLKVILTNEKSQIIIHQRDNNHEYEITSEIISDRCKSVLRLLDTNLVTKNINQVLKNLDNMGNSFDNSIKYDSEQKEFIKKQILDIAQ